MEWNVLAAEMLEVATSEMTKKARWWNLLKEDVKSGLLTLSDADGDSVCIDSEGETTDVCLDEDLSEEEQKVVLARMWEYPTTLSLYFSYEFGKGHFGKRLVNGEPKKFIPAWNAAFDYDYEGWEQRVIARLQNLRMSYPYAWVDSDSDFGFQSFILYISQLPEVEVFLPEPEEVEGDE
jgi:hypothetical protein